MCRSSLSWPVVGFSASHWEALPVGLEHILEKGEWRRWSASTSYTLDPLSNPFCSEVQLQIFAVTYSFVWRYPNDNNSLSRIHCERAFKGPGGECRSLVAASSKTMGEEIICERRCLGCEGSHRVGGGWFLSCHLQTRSVPSHQGTEMKVLILANWSLEALDLILKISVGSNGKKYL